MNNQAVGETGPFFGWQKSAQVPLDLCRILLPGKTEASGEPLAVSVNNDPGCIEGMAQNHIGGFSSYARKPGQFLHRRRHLATEFFH